MSNELDRIVVDGDIQHHQPSEGWTFILIVAPNYPVMKLREQPAPQEMIQFHHSNTPDSPYTIFTCVGRDDAEKTAYFLKGMWGYTDKPVGEVDLFGDDHGNLPSGPG